VLELLGSKTVPVWFDQDEKSREPFTQSFDDFWLEMMKEFHGNGDVSFSESETTPFWQAYYALDGSRETFVNDLDQSWRLYKLQALVYALTKNLDTRLQRKARTNVQELIHGTHPRRVWLYVKHRRWMLSDEYAIHQETYIGMAPLYAAKTKSLFRGGREDEVIRAKPTTDQRLLSTLIDVAGMSEAK